MSQSPELRQYLRRIGFEGTARPDLATLAIVHRLHSESIPYENLDVQLGRKVGRDIAGIFDKIVAHGRGGWCYEMNGLLFWALEEIGFAVTQHAGAVIRQDSGLRDIASHLVLLVELDQLYLVDVGFGDGIIEPVPLAAAKHIQRGFDFGLTSLPDGWWRFHNHARSSTPNFDFSPDLADHSLLDSKCEWLQSDPGSPFVLNAVCQRYTPASHHTLRGRVLTTLTKDNSTQRLVSDELDYVKTLGETFSLRFPEAEVIWPRIVARHAQLFAPDGMKQ